MCDEVARRCDGCRHWVPLCEQWGGEDFGACRLEVERAVGVEAPVGEALRAVARRSRPSWYGPERGCPDGGVEP